MIPFLPIALVGYTVGMVLAGVGTLYRSVTAHRAAAAVFAFTWAVHLAAIAQKAAGVGRMPLGNVGEYLLVLGWLVLTFHLYIWFRWRIQVAGMVLTPIAGLAALAAMYFISPDLPGSAWIAGPGSCSTCRSRRWASRSSAWLSP